MTDPTSNREIHSVPESALQCGCHHPTRKLRCTRIRRHTGVHRAPHWTDDHWVEWPMTPTCSAELHGASAVDQAVFCENPATDGPWCDEHEPPAPTADCPGHPTLNADGDPETVHCDGSCAA